MKMAVPLTLPAGLPPLPLDALAVPLLLGAILAAHLLYYRRARQSDGQQRVQLSNWHRPGHAATGALLLRAERRRFDRSGESLAALAPAPPLLPLTAERAPALRLAEGLTLADRHWAGRLVLVDDLCCSGRCRFEGTVKVGGDLLIDGHVRFTRPVIVAGSAHVRGQAHFDAGLLVKGTLLIDGGLVIGTATRPGWVAARDIALNAWLWLHGELIGAALPAPRQEAA